MQVSHEAGKVAWYFHLFKNFPVCCDPHKVFSIVNTAEVDFFLEFPCFFYDLVDVDSVCLVPLPFLNPACTSGILGSRTVEALMDLEHYLARM